MINKVEVKYIRSDVEDGTEIFKESPTNQFFSLTKTLWRNNEDVEYKLLFVQINKQTETIYAVYEKEEK